MRSVVCVRMDACSSVCGVVVAAVDVDAAVDALMGWMTLGRKAAQSALAAMQTTSWKILCFIIIV